MGKRATTAVVAITYRSDVYVERITPHQVLVSGWIHGGNSQRDKPGLLVQVAVERILRRRTRYRRVNVDVDTNGTWVAFLPGAHYMQPHGRWEITDGEPCLEAVRAGNA